MFEPLTVIWQSLPKAIPKNNRRFWLQNQRPRFWGCSLAQLGRVRWASVSTGHFLVGDSRCGQRQARLSLEEKMPPLLLYLLSSRVNKVFIICKFLATTSHFLFHVKWNFDGIGEKLLPTKAAPIASLRSKICLKFQVLSSHFLKAMSCSKSIEHAKWKYFNSNWSKVCVQEFWYIMSGLDIQPGQSNNPARKKVLQVARNKDPFTAFFPSNWYESMIQWLRCVAVSRTTRVWFPMGIEILCP